MIVDWILCEVGMPPRAPHLQIKQQLRTLPNSPKAVLRNATLQADSLPEGSYLLGTIIDSIPLIADRPNLHKHKLHCLKLPKASFAQSASSCSTVSVGAAPLMPLHPTQTIINYRFIDTIIPLETSSHSSWITEARHQYNCLFRRSKQRMVI